MSNKKDDINQKMYDFKLNVTNKERTTSEIFNHKNERINDDCEYGVEGVEIRNDAEELATIDQLICVQDIETDQDDPSLNPSNGSSNLNDEATGTPTNSVNMNQCIKTRASEDCHLPALIFILFPSQNQQEVINILRRVQDETDTIWAYIDKRYKNKTITLAIRSQMYGEFRRAFESYLSKEYSTQAKPVKEAQSILENTSFGTLFLNTKNEILGVQNHHGTWSAPKGHPKLKIDGTLETPWETLLRELFEELSIKFKRSKREKTLNKDNIAHFIALNKDNFLECHIDSGSGIDNGLRRIGLLIVPVDESIWKFSLENNKENKDCRWLKIDDIIRNKPEIRSDIYYTLRPFARYLKDHPMP